MAACREGPPTSDELTVCSSDSRIVSFNSSGYNFVIGLLVKPYFVRMLADLTKPSPPLFSSVTTADGHRTRLSSLWTTTTSPILIMFVDCPSLHCFALLACISRRAGKYSDHQRPQHCWKIKSNLRALLVIKVLLTP